MLSSFSYYYQDGAAEDKVGSILRSVYQWESNTYTATYRYDNVNRLIYEGRNPSTYAYSYDYDAMGNRLHLANTGGNNTTYTYDLDSNSQLDTELSGDTVNTYLYDNRGNTTKKEVNNGQCTTTTYTYDDANKLTKAQYPGGTSSVFSYDGEGRLAKRVRPDGEITYYLYQGGSLVTELDADGNADWVYTNGPNGLLYIRAFGISYYVGCDQLGSVWDVVELDDEWGVNRVGGYSYTAFGNVTASGAVTGWPFEYAGRWGYHKDYDSDLTLLGARWYAASTGRFMTVDPIKDGENWYTYAGNRPTTYVDPAGTNPILCVILIVVIIIAGAVVLWRYVKCNGGGKCPPGSLPGPIRNYPARQARNSCSMYESGCEQHCNAEWTFHATDDNAAEKLRQCQSYCMREGARCRSTGTFSPIPAGYLPPGSETYPR